MKKSFMYIFLCIILICFVGSIFVKSSNLRRYFVLKAIPIIKIVNEESNIGNISYMNIIRYKLMSENIFIELPEDKVELVDENVDDEVLMQEVEIENNTENNVKSVTLDLYNNMIDNNVATEYEKKFSDKGVKICRLEAYKDK